MKKFFLTIAFVTASLVCFAQKQKVSVVELQNGSVIRGVILESAEGTVRVKTADQSVFVYPESDIVNITETNEALWGFNLNSRGPQKGKLRGFVDAGYNMKMFGAWSSSVCVDGSIGYQLLDWLYAGGGAGIHYGFTDKSIISPVFADVRIDFINHSITPFVGARLGYEFEIMKTEGYDPAGNGFYLNPSLGCRVAINDKMGLNLSIGYGFRYLPREWYRAQHDMSFRVGVEF